MGSKIQQIDRQPKTSMQSFTGRTIESIGPHHLTRQVRRCGVNGGFNEVSADYAATRIRFHARARDIPPRLSARADEVIE
jgi:hypothetical protein